MDERAVPENYDPEKYPRVAASVDVVVLTIRDGDLCALVVKRENAPYQGWWSLPGTFLYPTEDADWAARRAVSDKTGIVVRHVEQLRTYTAPDRDPRMRVVSIGYLAFGPIDETAEAGYHATDVDWLPLFKRPAELAFDHQTIMVDGLRRAQDKLEYTTLATSFLPEQFTIGDLKEVYETVWNHPLDKANFYRKLRSSKGVIEPTGEKLGRRSNKNALGSSNALLYRAGDAKMLYPPIRREGGAW